MKARVTSMWFGFNGLNYWDLGLTGTGYGLGNSDLKFLKFQEFQNSLKICGSLIIKSKLKCEFFN